MSIYRLVYCFDSPVKLGGVKRGNAVFVKAINRGGIGRVAAVYHYDRYFVVAVLINITAQKRLTEEYKPEGDPAYAFSFTGTDGTTITAGYYEYDTNFYAAVVGDKVYLINKMNVRDLTDVYDTMINGDSEEEKQSESDSTESDAEDTAEATATSEK